MSLSAVDTLGHWQWLDQAGHWGEFNIEDVLSLKYIIMRIKRDYTNINKILFWINNIQDITGIKTRAPNKYC